MAKGGPSFSIDRWLRLNAMWLLPALVALSVAASVIGVLGAWVVAYDSPVELLFLKPLDGWGYWMLFLGALAALVLGFYLAERISMQRELNGYLTSASKAKFLANLDRIEELGWRLGGAYEKRVIAKKGEFKLKW
ncbi:MAG: DUF3198 domain-containing protein [Euryarchaeota archaeon]|nr:DUF3198 domain-containing protein [Euryarchaeota archaeon]